MAFAPNSFTDGQVIDDIDAVILRASYVADWSSATFVEMSKPAAHGYKGLEIRKLYMNLLPPAYACARVTLCYPAFGKNNGLSFADVTPWAVSNVWRGIEKLLSKETMETWNDKHQAWVASRWALDPTISIGCAKQWEFQGWRHQRPGLAWRI